MVEQGTHKPLVGGPNPPVATIFCCGLRKLELDMDRKKALINEYKQRKITGGIFKVTNTQNGRYLLDYTPNLQAKHNSFDFMSSSNTCFDYKLKKDWEAFGNQAFTFDIIASIDKKDAQTQDEFMLDLQTLAQLWSEKLDSSMRY